MRRYKWTILFGLLSLLCLAVVLGAFVWGWSRLGLETGFYVLLMIYGYIGFFAMVKAITDGVRKLRKARA